MDLNDLLQMGATVFRDSNLSGAVGSSLDIDAITSALSGLMGGSGGFHLSSLVENLGAGGLGEIANSWLGDGENQPISPEQIGTVIGADQLSQASDNCLIVHLLTSTVRLPAPSLSGGQDR